MAFSPDVLEAICSYMNNDPTESNLTIIQGHTNDRSFTRADLICFDEKGADFKAYSPSEEKEIRLPWQREISERPEVREQLMALLNKAMDNFGTR
jgi:Protein of unknown function (DUF2470)